MNRRSSSAVGNSSAMASQRSSSRRRSRGAGRLASTPETAVTAMAHPSLGTMCRWPGSPVDLLQFDLGPLDRVLGRHALHGLGVHVGDDVLRERFLALG